MVSSTCQVESPTENSEVSTQESTVAVGEVVGYSCVDGYVRVTGDEYRACQVNGQLSGEPLMCEQDCPEGWTFSGPSRQCYKFFSDTLDYDSAIAQCAAINGKMPMPKSEYENDQLLSEVNSRSNSVWLGLDDRATEGTFVWVDGTPADGWSNWNDGEPNDHGIGEDCTQLKEDGHWNDVPCDRSYNYVCQVPVEEFADGGDPCLN